MSKRKDDGFRLLVLGVCWGVIGSLFVYALGNWAVTRASDDEVSSLSRRVISLEYERDTFDMQISQLKAEVRSK
jgi:hypothetical protein